MRIREKLLFYILVPLLTLFSIVNLAFYFYSVAFLEKKASLILLSKADEIRRGIQYLIHDSASDLNIMLNNRMIADYFMYSELKLLDSAEDTRWKIEKDFLKTAQEKREYVTVRLSTLKGRSAVDIIDRKISDKHIDSSNDEWFRSTLQLGRDDFHISTLHPCREHNKESVLVSRLYYNDVDRVQGVGSLHVHVDTFFKNIIERAINETGYTYLIDHNGIVVAHRDKDKRGLNLEESESTRNLLAGKKGILTEIDEP